MRRVPTNAEAAEALKRQVNVPEIEHVPGYREMREHIVNQAHRGGPLGEQFGKDERR
jgi:hypothetical protein